METLVNNLINSTTLMFGHPSSPMRFLPKKIEQVTNTTYELTGQFPESPFRIKDYCFTIDKEQLEQFKKEGETWWIADDGAFCYLSGISVK